ncbi:hypothetical protein [Mycobacterium intracellulare]|uniref:hypothetical protein n=1 Tax=Mycobacterium intracellulare TaxID=1767 RepID=UPI001EED69CD|nr:hypothetical protein [Mycobacterium intracellulare]MEE3750574.1 hypothetical protein [Mycobacterium intracellulare]
MSNIYPAPAIVVGVDGSRADTSCGGVGDREAVSRDIPLRLVCVIDPHAALADAHRAVDARRRTGQGRKRTSLGAKRVSSWPRSRSAVTVCTAQVSSVVVEVDNGTVLRRAFEEAGLRGAALRAVSI